MLDAEGRLAGLHVPVPGLLTRHDMAVILGLMGGSIHTYATVVATNGYLADLEPTGLLNDSRGRRDGRKSHPVASLGTEMVIRPIRELVGPKYFLSIPC